MRKALDKNDRSYSEMMRVVAVYPENRTVDCVRLIPDIPEDDRLVENVKLSSSNDGIYNLPAINSNVVVSFEERTAPYVTLYSAVSQVYIQTTVQQGGGGIDVADKIDIYNNDMDILTIMEGLVQLLRDFKVQTAWGPSATATPDIVDKINELESDIEKLFIQTQDRT
jgi:hypothetical protein